MKKKQTSKIIGLILEIILIITWLAIATILVVASFNDTFYTFLEGFLKIGENKTLNKTLINLHLIFSVIVTIFVLRKDIHKNYLK